MSGFVPTLLNGRSLCQVKRCSGFGLFSTDLRRIDGLTLGKPHLDSSGAEHQNSPQPMGPTEYTENAENAASVYSVCSVGSPALALACPL